MDTAQLARNISEGKGYTTSVHPPVQPLSRAKAQSSPETHGSADERTPILRESKRRTPTLPIRRSIPLVLAGLMKVLPFHYDGNLKRPFWANGGSFWRYQPDFLIAIFNELLLLVVGRADFFARQKTFRCQRRVALGGPGFGCELLWRFSVSGLSTMLLLVIFLGLALVLLEIRDERRAKRSRMPAGCSVWRWRRAS